MPNIDDNDNIVLTRDEYEAVCKAISVYREQTNKLEQYIAMLEKHIKLLQEYNAKKCNNEVNNKIVTNITTAKKPKKSILDSKPIIEFLDT